MQTGATEGGYCTQPRGTEGARKGGRSQAGVWAARHRGTTAPLDRRERTIRIFVVCAYSPISSASEFEKAVFEHSLEEYHRECGETEIFVMGAYINDCLGVRRKGRGRDKVVGP